MLFGNQEMLTRISGALVMLMALLPRGIAAAHDAALYQEFRFHPHLERFGPVAAPVAGAAFGLGWTPCIGPCSAPCSSFARRGEDLRAAAVLLVAYSLGLGVSFLAVGLASAS